MLSKNVTAISNRGDDTWRRGAAGRKYTTMCIFTSTHMHTNTPIHLHKYTGETWSCHQLTNKWQTNDMLEHLHQGLIVIALRDCAIGISQWERERERERGEREQGLCVILHKQNLCQTRDLIASSAINCVQSNLSVNLGCREWKHG